ncbi:MAG: hypothetical protein ACRCXZ_00620 [Patescibacteria group bacterium]
MNSILENIFSVVFIYYILTVFTLPILGLMVGIYQTLKPNKFNQTHSFIWLFVSLLVILAVRSIPLIYYPDFGCDNCENKVTDSQVLSGFVIGLICSILIYAFPFYRQVKAILLWSRTKFKKNS